MKPTKKQQPGAAATKKLLVEVSVSTLDPEGYSIGITDNKQIRVRGALPGDTVLAKIEHSGKYGMSGQMVKVLSKSPHRRISPCKSVSDCDGCSLIAYDYDAELLWKRELVRDQVHHYPLLAQTEVLPVIPSPKSLAYRSSAKLVIGGTFAHPVIGIYKRESHQLLDISECPLHHPLINKVITAVKKGITKGKVPIFHQRSGQGLLRYLLVRVAESDQRVMVIFVTAKRSYNELHHLAAHLKREVPETAVIAQNINPSAGNAILGNSDFFHTKATNLEVKLGEVKFLVSPRSFFQVNSGSAHIIYELVRKLSLQGSLGNVLDLYCGIGAISLFLSTCADSVLGIELAEPAVQDAILNTRINRITNCHFEAGDVADHLHTVIQEGNKIDLAVLNPPRKGCDSKVLSQLAVLRPSRIIYVSCSPPTLARDLMVLHDSGYLTESVQPVDMFPHTTHVESVALLSLRHHS